MAFFSIIIPTFNSANTISDCIKSVLDQTFDDFEILIQDGCSTDNTSEIVENFSDDRIVFYSERDAGVYDAMNKAVLRAKGKWFYFLGSDDSLYSNFVLERIGQVLKNVENKVVYGNVNVIGDIRQLKLNSDEFYRGETLVEDLFFENICHQAIFYNASLFKEDGHLYDLKYPILADHMLNLLFASRFNFLYVPVVVANFTIGGVSTTESDSNFQSDRWLNIIKYYGSSLKDQRFYSARSYIRKAGKAFIKSKEYGLAKKAFSIYIYFKIKNAYEKFRAINFFQKGVKRLP